MYQTISKYEGRWTEKLRNDFHEMYWLSTGALRPIPQLRPELYAFNRCKPRQLCDAFMDIRKWKMDERVLMLLELLLESEYQSIVNEESTPMNMDDSLNTYVTMRKYTWKYHIVSWSAKRLGLCVGFLQRLPYVLALDLLGSARTFPDPEIAYPDP